MSKINPGANQAFHQQQQKPEPVHTIKDSEVQQVQANDQILKEYEIQRKNETLIRKTTMT